MKWNLGWILCLLMALICEAAEIVAWKVPLNRFVEQGLEAAGIVPCKSSPEPSPFFKKGDVLWDLKGISPGNRIQTVPALEWAVWNENSETLVIKADWNGIWQLHQRLKLDELQKQCRITAEVFEVQADGLPLSDKSVPSLVHSCVSKSGQEAESIYHQHGKMIRLKSNATIGAGAPVVDLGLEISISLPDQPGLEINTGLTLISGSAVWAARDFDGTKGMDLRMSSSIELLDGTPMSHALMIQKGDAVSPIVVDRRQIQRHRIGDKGWLTTQWLNPMNLADADPPDPSADPFAERDPKEVPKPKKFREVMVPEILRPWFDRPVWDLREWTRNAGLELKDGSDFAGYDPLTQNVFIFSNSERLLDMFEALYSPMCCLRPAMLVATFDGNGQSRLVARSGQRCRLKRAIAEQKEIRFIEIEPTLGETGDMIDMRLHYRNDSVTQGIQSLKTAVTLRNGRALELISGGNGEAKQSLRVKAEVIRVP